MRKVIEWWIDYITVLILPVWVLEKTGLYTKLCYKYKDKV